MTIGERVMTHLLAFAVGTVFGAFVSFGIGCWLSRRPEPRTPLTLVDPHQLSITDLAEWAESRGPRGIA